MNVERMEELLNAELNQIGKRVRVYEKDGKYVPILLGDCEIRGNISFQCNRFMPVMVFKYEKNIEDFEECANDFETLKQISKKCNTLIS